MRSGLPLIPLVHAPAAHCFNSAIGSRSSLTSLCAMLMLCQTLCQADFRQAVLTQIRLPCRNRHQLRSPWRWTMGLPVPWQRLQGRRALLQRGPSPCQVCAPSASAHIAAFAHITGKG